MKQAAFALLALCVSSVNVDTETSTPIKLFNNLYNKKYHGASSKDKIISGTQELYNAAPCQYWYDNAWYNFIDMDGFDSTTSFQAASNSSTVYFTMCQLIKNANATICTGSGNDDFAAAKIGNTNTNCTALSTGNLDSIAQIDYTLANGDTTLGLYYSDPATNCSLKLGLICDENMADAAYTTSTLKSLNGSTCMFETTMTSKLACPVYSLNSLWEWMNEYYWLWGAILIFIGFFLGLFGQKLFSVTLFLIGTIVTVAFVWLLFYSTFLSDATEGWVAWVVLGCSILIGLLGGFLLYKCQRLGAAIIGGWGGFLLGVVFYTTVLWAVTSEVAFWIISIACALIAAGLAFVFYFHAVILSTSFVGSYFFVRGISLYAGGYPNEWTLIEMIQSGAISHISYWFYLYLFFIIVLTVLTAIFQYKHFKQGVEDGDYDANGHPKHPYDTGDDEKKCLCC